MKPVKLEFLRWLHRSYMQAGGLGQFIKMRVTPMGWTLLGSIVFTGLFSSDVTRSQSYVFFCILISLAVMALAWTLGRGAKLSAHRKLPRFATAWETMSYEIEVENTGRRTVKGGFVQEMAPDPRPDLETFSKAREPWERERNAFDRKFAFYRWRWLIQTSLLFRDQVTVDLPHLKPGAKVMLQAELTPERRGVALLGDLRVGLPDPVGFFHRLRKVESPTDKVVVLPRRYRLPDAWLDGRARSQFGGEAASNQRGQSAEYVSMRDYQAGDPLRHIHWKGWAKTGKPVVLEFEEAFFPRYGLILDTKGDFTSSELFETAVSIAASFVSRIDTQECLVELMFLEGKAMRVAAGRGEAREDELLETLAAVKMQAVADYEKLLRLVSSHSSQLTSAFMPLAGWDADRATLVSKLVASGLELTVFPVFASRKQAEEALRAYPCVAPWVPVHLSTVQEDLLLA